MLGASALFTGPVDPFEPFVRVAPRSIVVMTATLGAFLALIVFGAVRSRRIGLGAPDGGDASRSGATGQVRSPLSPSARSSPAARSGARGRADGEPIERGTPVRVVKVEGMTLTVEPDASSSRARDRAARAARGADRR